MIRSIISAVCALICLLVTLYLAGVSERFVEPILTLFKILTLTSTILFTVISIALAKGMRLMTLAKVLDGVGRVSAVLSVLGIILSVLAVVWSASNMYAILLLYLLGPLTLIFLLAVVVAKAGARLIRGCTPANENAKLR